jgi:hypothetical protein
VLALCCTALTFGFSPLAFVFLSLALAALFLRRRRLTTRVLAVAAVVVVLTIVEVGLLSLFPISGLVYPFGSWRLLAGLAVAGSGAALALRAERARTLAFFFLVWGTASIAAYAVPSAIGHNVLRASTFVFPLTCECLLLAADADVSLGPPRERIPPRGRPDGQPLGGVLLSPSGLCACARLVPATRHR